MSGVEVVLTTDVYHPMMSGVTRVIDILLEELPRYGIKLKLLAPQKQKEAIRLRRINGGLLISMRAFRLRGIYSEMLVPDPLSTMISLRLRNNDVFGGDIIVHAHTPYVATSVLRVALSKRRKRIPIILTYHTLVNKYIDYRFGKLGNFLKIFDKAMLANVFRRCSYIVFPSEYAKDVTLNYLGLSRVNAIRKKIILIRNPLPRKIYKQPSKRISEFYDFLEEYNYAVWVGRVSHEKNLPFILKVFSGLPYKLVIAGKGPLLETLRRIAPRNVHFLGFVPDDVLRSLLYYSRLMIIASTFDNMPLAVLEAMAQGVPVISYYVGGHNEIIKNGYNGFKYKTSREAREIISRIFRDDELYERLRVGAKETAMLFHPEKIIPQYIELYKRVAE